MSKKAKRNSPRVDAVERAISRFSVYWKDLDPERKSLAHFITVATEQVGGRKAACELLGISPVTLDNFRQGKTQPKALELLLLMRGQTAAITSHFDKNMKPIRAKLDANKESLRELFEQSKTVSPRTEIPMYDVSASAGAGALVQTNSPDGFLAVDREWLSRYVSRNANVGVLEASGDSMMPTIRNRDLLLVDAQEGTTVQEMMRGAIYVMTLDGGLVVKRLDIDGNILLVVSDNPAYETVRIPFEDIDGRLIIHGVVFWSGGALDTHR